MDSHLLLIFALNSVIYSFYVTILLFKNIYFRLKLLPLQKKKK